MQSMLRRLGLTEGEANVYLALLELGSSSTGKITKRSGVSGSKVYEVLDRLIDKGLASSIDRNGVLHFEATGPERIIDYLEEKQEQIEEEKALATKLIPQLLLRQQGKPRSEAKVYTGFEGLKTANEDIIRSLKRGEEWLSMGLTEQPKAWEIHFTKRQEVRAKKGIVHKHLLNEKYRSLLKTRQKLPHTEYRLLPAEFEMPTSTEIYKDKVTIMILTPESPLAIVVESKPVADSFRKYFYALWKSAKKGS